MTMRSKRTLKKSKATAGLSTLPEAKPLTVKVANLARRSDNFVFRQLKVTALTSALLEIRDALKTRFPDDPRASVVITPFNDGFTLTATGLDDDEAPADASARQIANVLFSEKPQIRRISNRVVHRTTNRGA